MKKISKEYIQSKWGNNLHFNAKNQLNTEENNNMENCKKKKIRYMVNKQQNDRSKLLLISKYFKCKLIKLLNQKSGLAEGLKTYRWSNYILSTRDSL